MAFERIRELVVFVQADGHVGRHFEQGFELLPFGGSEFRTFFGQRFFEDFEIFDVFEAVAPGGQPQRCDRIGEKRPGSGLVGGRGG